MLLSSRRACVTALLLLAALPASALRAQWQSNTGPAGAVLGATVGGDVERYLRALLVAGIVTPMPFTTRPFGPEDVRDIMGDSTTKAHPWSDRLRARRDRRASLGTLGFVSANSGFPWGASDGAMWQGRGVTSSVGAAATFRWGPLNAVFAPVLYSAENAAYPLMRVTVSGQSPLLDPLLPLDVDLPQRMGTTRYTQFDAGESTIRLSGHGAAIGLSTASLGWGSGEAFPSIFGANGGGFPHAFVGTTGRGVRLAKLGTVSARYIIGTLPQSDFSTVQGSETYVDRTQSGTRRIGTGITASFMPGVLPGLELGASRFFHSPYLQKRPWRSWSKPFEGLYKDGFQGRNEGAGDAGSDQENQLASVFARWAFPRRGGEASFEVLRDDHNWDGRDFALEPENNSAVLATIRAVTHRDASVLSLLTLEYFDGDVRPIAQQRPQAFLYANSVVRQGHTVRGQLLGTPLGAGAVAGQRASWERFTATGSWRVNLQRWRTRALPSDDRELLFRQPGQPAPNNHDWIVDASVANSRYRNMQVLSFEAGVAWAGIWQFGNPRSNLYARASYSLF